MKTFYSLEEQIEERINLAANYKGLQLSNKSIIKIRIRIIKALDKLIREDNESLPR